MNIFITASMNQFLFYVRAHTLTHTCAPLTHTRARAHTHARDHTRTHILTHARALSYKEGVVFFFAGSP